MYHILRFMDWRGPLAQLVEHWTFNPLVAGSSPAGPTVGQRFRVAARLHLYGRAHLYFHVHSQGGVV